MRSCWLTRFDKPEPFVDASGDLGEQRSSIVVHQFSRLRALIAGMFPKVGKRRGKGLAVTGTRQPIPVERGTLGDYLCCSLGLATKLHDALGEQVGIRFHFFDDLVEELAQGQECRSLMFQ
ncbi:MAG TPA: hypothetical protein VFV38_26695 [Ktedonobacteraceae bacterium]|nr:hypothetical protein [Ktedonobacteraceae bacterium]